MIFRVNTKSDKIQLAAFWSVCCYAISRGIPLHARCRSGNEILWTTIAIVAMHDKRNPVHDDEQIFGYCMGKEIVHDDV